MGIFSIILLVCFIVVSLILVFLVAIQSDDSVGLGGVFGGNSESAFGSNTVSFLHKATTVLAILFMVLALLVSLAGRASGGHVLEALQETQTEAGTTWLESENATAADSTALEADAAGNDVEASTAETGNN